MTPIKNENELTQAVLASVYIANKRRAERRAADSGTSVLSSHPKQETVELRRDLQKKHCYGPELADVYGHHGPI
jgi:hypothetical protein